MRAVVRSASSLVLAAAACSSVPAPETETPAKPVAEARFASGTPSGPLPTCTAPPPVPERDAAILELFGHSVSATARLDAIVAAAPESLAAETLLVISLEMAAMARADAERALPAQVLQLAKLPTGPAGTGAGPQRAPGAPLLRVAAQRRNLITDDEAWFERNGLPPPPDLAAAPEYVPARVREQPLQRLFMHDRSVVAAYGERWLVVFGGGHGARLYELPQQEGGDLLQVGDAQVVSDRLLVQLAYNGYAAASGGRNGYLAAYALDSGALVWRSAPLVANAQDFVVVGDAVVSGYGFTTEPDFVVVTDLATGAVRQKLKVHAAPSYLRRKGDRLYVRTYDTDYELVSATSQGLPGESPPAAVAPSSDLESDPIVCWLRSAAAAIDERNSAALSAATAMLDELTGRYPAIVAPLEVAQAKISAMRESRAIDLWRKPPQRLAATPFARTVVSKTRPLPSKPSPRFVQTDVKPADPARDPAPPAAGDPIFIAPVDEGRSPYVTRGDIPVSYGRESLRAVIPSGDYQLLIYGGRYLIAIHNYEVVQRLDLDALRHPPAANPQWQAFASQDATYAQVVGDTLYVCNGGGSYAREVFGKKGFVTAIELATGVVRWRSDPLVCNAAPFAVSGDYLITGYGFTDESDFLYALRLADGSAIAQYRLASAPDAIKLENERVQVDAYNHQYTFELK